MIFKRNYLSDNIYHEKEIVFITCLFWLIAKLISWKAWTAYRLFPLVPAFDFLKNLPAAYHLVLFFASLFCLVILVIKPSVQIAVILIVAELLSLIADQNRWQPWEYQYLFIISMFWLKIKKTKQFYCLIRTKKFKHKNCISKILSSFLLLCLRCLLLLVYGCLLTGIN